MAKKTAIQETPRVQKVIKFIETLIVPSGNGAGEPFKLMPFQKNFIRDIYGPTNKGNKRIVRRAILSIGRKNGKGLALDTPLPTPSGWTTMGEISAGDKLYDSDGNICSVTMVSDIRNLDCYEIEFSNGEKIICDGDHLWETTARVNDPGSARVYPRVKGRAKQVRDTRNLFKTQTYGNRNDRNHSIDMPLPIYGEKKDLPVDPYVLGAWLGDGNSSSASISCGNEDIDGIVKELELHGVQTSIKKDKSCWKVLIQKKKELCARGHDPIHWKIIYGKNTDHTYRKCLECERETRRARKKGDSIPERTNPTIQELLRNIGVLNNKHIPEIYLRASIEQRIDLLHGLMDTDGTCDRQGRAQEWTTTKKHLLEGFCELLASLGIKYSIREKKLRCNGRDVKGIGYYVQFCCLRDVLPVFSLSRKLTRQKYTYDRKTLCRSRTIQIVSIKEVDSVPTKCIQVDSPTELFLCGRTMIPTHNTALIAALALTHLVGPEAIENGECYSAATEREQAALTFKYAAQIVRADHELSELIKVVDSTKTMYCIANGSFYRALSAEAGTKMGLNPSVVIYDELAQAKNRDLYDALDTSMAAREEPLFIVISTQSNDPQHILSQIIDDGLSGNDPTTVCHLYAVPDDAEDIFDDEKLWELANPALGDFRSLDEMRTAAQRAKRMPTFEAAFRNLYLNQRVDAQSPFIPRAEWEECKGDAEYADHEEIYLGLDLSGKTDLTSLMGVSNGESDKVKSWFWKPKETLLEHEKRDRVPYSVWEKQGYIKTTPGRAIQYSYIAQELAEINKTYTILGMAFDRYRIDDLMNAMSAIGLDCYVDGKDNARYGAIRLVPWGQGYASMTQAVEALEIAVLERKLVHDGHPCLTWNISNAMIISDAAGNKKLDKSKTRFRIDGAVALAMAEGLKSRDKKEVMISTYSGLTVEQMIERMSF